MPSRRILSLDVDVDPEVGPGEPERETGWVEGPDWCFDLCFFLRIDVSVPLPASDRIGDPGRFLDERDFAFPSVSVRILSGFRVDGVVVPDGMLALTEPSGKS